MPQITKKQIQFLPEDRYLIQENSGDITPATYTTLFNGAIRDGETMEYFKFLEEIEEKDPDINHAIGTRTSQITSKEWEILNEDGEEDDNTEKIKKALKAIKGDPTKGLLTLNQLISSLLGVSYLTGISVNEVVTDNKEILGFNHIPSHFLTFRERVHYPALFTQEIPTGANFNKEKMLIHYLQSGKDPARGYLGNVISWQYVLKRLTLTDRLRYQNKYGRSFLLTTMPGDRDSYLASWEAAEELIENLDDVDGGVFPDGVTAQFVEGSKLDGEYFFKSDEEYKRNIVKIILGQESTTSSQDSNRSTAEVHESVLEKRVVEDMELLQNTLNKQLISKVKQLLSISEDDVYEFKFIIGTMEATMDDELEEENINEEGNTDGQSGQNE